MLNLSGEALPGQLVDDRYATGRATAVYNLYVPCGNTTFVTVTRAPRRPRARSPNDEGPALDGPALTSEHAVRALPRTVGLAGPARPPWRGAGQRAMPGTARRMIPGSTCAGRCCSPIRALTLRIAPVTAGITHCITFNCR